MIHTWGVSHIVAGSRDAVGPLERFERSEDAACIVRLSVQQNLT